MRTLSDRYEQYKKAVERLNEVIEVYEEKKDQIIVDAMIQRFEFCVELS